MCWKCCHQPGNSIQNWIPLTRNITWPLLPEVALRPSSASSKQLWPSSPIASFTLVYGNRNRASIIFKEQLEALKNVFMSRFVVHHILSREKTDAAINYGRINAAKGKQLAEKLIDIRTIDDFFLCGPEEMIFEMKDWLEQEGIDKKESAF